MNALRIVDWLVVTALISGCGGQAGPRAPQVAQAPAADPAAFNGPAIPPLPRRIIYHSQIEVVVDDLAAAQQKLTELIKPIEEAGGYLARQEISGRTGLHRSSSWTIRVPLSRFDGFVAEVEKLGELQRHSREAQDVTEAYADLEARLRNKQSAETRLLSHLDKTGELKDTLEVERELSRVRGEVEQLQGQLNLLKNKTELATVDVTLHERQSYVPPTAPNFAAQVRRTFDASWRGLLQAGQLAVLLVVAALPWAAVAGVMLVPLMIVRQLWRRGAERTQR